MSEQFGAVVLATHSREFLAVDGPLVQRVLLRRGPPVAGAGDLGGKAHGWSAELVPLRGALAEALRSDAAALGITDVDLLLFHRAIVFVEGHHDLALLDEMI